ncbi:HEXXH motif-containing putative peptide modification protein [Nonomuraea sp. NPDC048916]|uniref:aKG-HExxH-type peptide beta-hydroxylase n=1 Tax=Nonomuraea sp. NPDC048916 TaxID=3154232 RepID=UPI0034000DD8
MKPPLTDIAAGRIQPATVLPWRLAESRRHLILIEALRRKLLSEGPAPEFTAAHRHLAKAEREDPRRVRELLAAPQVGVWAARCLHATARPDTRYLAEVAAAVSGPRRPPELWIARHGLVLRLSLVNDDPYLDLYGDRDPAPGLPAWRDVLDAGWRLLGGHLHGTAAAMAETLRVLVPLLPAVSGVLRSSTSGWAFGAIAMSMPADDVECAETLLHEFRHVLLGAVTNHVPLARPDSGWTGRAPWRGDPRPAENLLQGCYAYAGLIGLWRLLLDTPHHDRALAGLRAWEEQTRAAIGELAGSGALTAEGELFVAEMRHSL